MAAIIKMIWAFVGPMLVDLALTVGIPGAMKWLAEKFPWVPKFVIDGVIAFLKAVLDGIKGVKEVSSEAAAEIRSIKASNMSDVEKKWAVSAARKRAKEEARSRCSGVACPADTKSL